MNSIFRFATALAAALLLAGCGGAAPPPLEGAAIGGDFALTGTDGKAVRDTDFAGKYRLVYFGYTFCPDVCPTDMQRIARALQMLDEQDPAAAAKLVPIFISVDPERDTPAVVREFVSAFDKRIVGLTGSPAAIAQTARKYAIAVHKQAPSQAGGYLVDHTAVIYLMGPKGEPVTFLSQDMDAAEMVAELRKWVK